MKLEFLNHASMVLDIGDISVLFDPWFEGTCFKGNWGLRYQNPQAYDHAKRATHLWVSHFHSDHFHPPTLKYLAAQNPGIRVLSNASVNFQMGEPMRNFGFRIIQDLNERVWVQLSDQVQAIRFPTSGIDNMLLVECGNWRLLNYNDCNLPRAALSSLKGRLGRIDVLLTNFNHAGKLVEHPLRSVKEIIRAQQEMFSQTVEILDPRWIVPFASHHYYRAEEMQEQNRSLLEPDDLVATRGEVIPLPVGSAVTFQTSGDPVIEITCDKAFPSDIEIYQRETSASSEELLGAASKFLHGMKGMFFGVVGWVPVLVVYVRDIDQLLVLRPGRDPKLTVGPKEEAHIIAHSSALLDWFEGRYGTDTFFVGGPFEIAKSDLKPVHRFLLAGLLEENGVAPRQLLKMLSSKGGLRFLANRREELLAIARSGNLRVGFRS